MHKNGFTLLAAGVLSLGMTGFALAESHTMPADADCPEDSDTAPGCDMTGAEPSERGPVAGAATAPVPPDGAKAEGEVTMTGPGSDAGTGSDTGSDTGGAAATLSGRAATEAADCPEDDDTAPGCDMEGAQQSERGPVEGAATAPVPAEGGGAEGDKTMSGPDADPNADAPAADGADAGDAAAPEGGADAQAAAGADMPEGHPELAVAYDEDGRYFTAEDTPTFKIAADGKVDWLTYSGFRRYHSECHVCHGPEGEGSTYAPALKNSVMRMDYYDFYDVVVNGRKHVNASENSVMPAFGDNPNVMCYLDDIYVYLLARGAGALPRGRPGEREDKTDAIREAETACLGN